MIIQTLHDFQFAEYLLVTALLLHDELLAHCLDCVERTSIFFAGKVHFLREATFTNDLDLIKILHTQHRSCRRCGTAAAITTLLGRHPRAAAFSVRYRTLSLVLHLLGENKAKREHKTMSNSVKKEGIKLYQ